MLTKNAETVVDGMEIMRWQYSPGEWRELIERKRISVHEGPPRHVPGWATASVLAPFVLLPFWLGSESQFLRDLVWIPASLAGLTIAAAIVGLPVAGLVRALRAARNWGKRQTQLEADPVVLFTSLGVLCGTIPVLWVDRTHRLHALRLVNLEGSPTIELTFNSAWLSTTTLRIPVPHDLAEDAEEMVELLRAKVPTEAA